jgi:phage tail-like protein
MPESSVNAQKFDPYKNFKFKIKCDGRYVAGITEVSLLNQTNEVVRSWVSGDLSGLSKLPGQSKFDAITLKRGITHDHEFQQWASKSRNYTSENEGSHQDIREDIVIEMYNEAGQLTSAYKVFRCWVSEFQSNQKSDALNNEALIESIKLENEGWQLDV